MPDESMSCYFLFVFIFAKGLPLYLGYVSQYEKYWPSTIYRTLLINSKVFLDISCLTKLH